MRKFHFEEFGRNLRQVRLEKRISQEGLAEAAGVSARYVALIEAGDRNPTLGVVLGLAKALQVPPARLFREEREK